MKIDKLKKIAEENDYTCWTTRGDFYEFKRRMSMKFIKIKKTECNRIYFHNFYMCDEKDSNMIKACMDFSYTHPNDREEEKKFYLEHMWMNSPGFRYLTININNGDCYLNSDKKCEWEKKQFTLKERDEIMEKYHTTLDDFKLVEVVDED